MISCIIIEDQIPARKILQKYIKDVEMLELKGEFNNAISALDFLKENSVDLLFLDIHLPKLSGIDFLSVLPTNPYVILTTAFPDYALKGYELDIVDYLLKPFSFERFLKAVLKVERLINKIGNAKSDPNRNTGSMLVKVGYDQVKIIIRDISHIKSNGDYTHVFCCQQKYYVSYPLKYWLENLPANQFIQVHRSFIVNLSEIQKISSNTIEIQGNKIPIGRVYKKNFQKVYLLFSHK